MILLSSTLRFDSLASNLIIVCLFFLRGELATTSSTITATVFVAAFTTVTRTAIQATKTRSCSQVHPSDDSFIFYNHQDRNTNFGTGNIHSLPTEQIYAYLRNSGIIPLSSSSLEGLFLLARDFVDRPEQLSSLLIADFGFPPLVAHQTRALAFAALRGELQLDDSDDDDDDSKKKTSRYFNISTTNNEHQPTTITLSQNKTNGIIESSTNDNKNYSTRHNRTIHTEETHHEDTPPLLRKFSDKEFRSSVVNEPARKRKSSVKSYKYGLQKGYETNYPKLASELEEFYIFMTEPNTFSQENPIRAATAKVYMNHAKLFLGWCCSIKETNATEHNTNQNNNNGKNFNEQATMTAAEEVKAEFSLFDFVPNKEKESSNDIIQFIIWLRSREVSVSYEANLLRGIIKLLKYRFSKESDSDPLDGKNTFDDIPIIKEIRKLHRDANQRQRLAPRSSDETKKWITWGDYLDVTRNTKNEVLAMINGYKTLLPSKRKYAKGDTDRIYSLQQIRIAEAYQRYLILAIFSSIPDRQRTIRELEIGRTLLKDSATGCWMIKHGPADYKTGKHYGERPAMHLAEELNPIIDDFIANWRPSLNPSTQFLLVQSRTGRPMTGDSIFTRVARCCFKYTGKSVNPHLLRDIIVTHVRDTDASEKELEALALYMGHSVEMQRSSYDRRTLSTKIAPAIELIKSVNKIKTTHY